MHGAMNQPALSTESATTGYKVGMLYSQACHVNAHDLVGEDTLAEEHTLVGATWRVQTTTEHWSCLRARIISKGSCTRWDLNLDFTEWNGGTLGWGELSAVRSGKLSFCYGLLGAGLTLQWWHQRESRIPDASLNNTAQPKVNLASLHWEWQ